MASEQTEKPNLDKADKTDKVFHFVIALLKHSKTGKTDWNKLVEAEGIVTVNAAKKRWKRFQDAHELSDSCLTVCESKPRKANGSKKRKVEDREADDGDDGEEKNDSKLQSGDESPGLPSHEESQT